MLVWAGVYLAIVTAAVAIVLARREPTIVRGDWVFFLTSLFVLLSHANPDRQRQLAVNLERIDHLLDS